MVEFLNAERSGVGILRNVLEFHLCSENLVRCGDELIACGEQWSYGRLVLVS